ncbi:hypothetical protein RQ734_11635 [Roseomonas mucosa]|uniref:hypothetical protein n=1 Tax=Roseomonas mucosa TaxID=207340 RepID=UPI0028CD1F15|nr:hypothetical protein [Roseomonas mucosa]MDT8276716.1 hypothetical protein [Roseomonas mucosa]MDT8356801.1 hypothetical protein [Roseomonas mucosa]
MSESMVTRWAQGSGFVTVPKPDWWDGEWERLYPGGVRKESPDAVFGEQDLAGLLCFRLTGDLGWFVEFTTADIYTLVWCKTDAAYLDLVTLRGPAWMKLAETTQAADSLFKIANTLIGYARHGQGDHVHAEGYQNHIDTARARAEAQRRKQRGAAA